MRRRRQLRVGAGVALLVCVAATAALVVSNQRARPAALSSVPQTVGPPAAVTLVPQIHALSPGAPAPQPGVLAAVLAPLAGRPALGTLTGQVRDPDSGTVLWDAGAGVPQLPASTAKVLTVAAALFALGNDDVIHTRVLDSPEPGQVVLVGGGDPTLSAAPAGKAEHYPGAGRVDDLVAQVRASGVPVTSVVVDTAAYTGPTLAPGWYAADVGGGSSAPMEPVMVDGARRNPTIEDSPRSATPALDAGRLLAQRLGLPPESVSAGTAAPGARELATVSSAPLRLRLEQLMLASDNVLTEAVGREVAVARGMPASFAGAAAAVAATLRDVGIDVSGLDMRDVSGLSELDRAPARLFADVLSRAAGTGTQAQVLRPLLSMLPVAAVSGTLADRFDQTAAQAAAGWVRAKTGTLSGVNSLAGIVTDVDGRVLTFALISNGVDSNATRPALDAIAAALRACGCR